MKLRRLSALAATMLAVLSALSFPASAQVLTGALFFTPATLPLNAPLLDRPPLLRERFVTVGFGLLRQTLTDAAQDRAQKVVLPLFDDAVLEVSTSSFDPRDDGFSWIGMGKTADGEDQTVVLTVHNPLPGEIGATQIAGAEFWLGIRRFHLQQVAGTVHSIIEIDQAKLLDAEGDPPSSQDGSSTSGDDEGLLPSVPGEVPSVEALTNPPVHATSTSGEYYVDVLAVYTPAASRVDAHIATTLGRQIEQANAANDRSGLQFHFRLIHVEQVNYTETANSMETDLNRLTTNQISNVNSLRDTYYADLVTMVGIGWSTTTQTDGKKNLCGLSNRMDSVGSGFAAYAFSVIDLSPNCDSLTLPHEMGHNMSLRHDWAHDGGTGSPYTYNHGFVNATAKFRTIMALDSSNCPIDKCTHIPAWSDPDRTWNGSASGAADSDNAQALSNTHETVSVFRSIHNPFGAYDVLAQISSGIEVSGWAIDYDAGSDPINVGIYSDGVGVASTKANEPRPDVGNAYPAFGPNHGYDAVISLPVGSHNVCVLALNTGTGTDVLLGCKTITVRIDPFGNVDGIIRAPQGARVWGWAIDPDTAAPITVEFYLDGSATPAMTDSASQDRPDVGNANPSYGSNHGFNTAIPINGPNNSSHRICVKARNVGPGSDTIFPCIENFYFSADPFGAINIITRTPGGARVSGWGIDPDTTNPIAVRFEVNDVPVMADVAVQSRPDVGSAYPDYGANHGYSTIVPMIPGQSNKVCVYGTNQLAGSDARLGNCQYFTPAVNPYGSLDSITRSPVGARVIGWTIDPDTAAPIAVRFTLDGVDVPPASVDAAAQPNITVGNNNPDYGPLHGFDSQVPITSDGLHQVCAYGVNIGLGADMQLGCLGITLQVNPFGAYDAANWSGPGTIRVAGWAIDPDTAAPIPIKVTIDNLPPVTLAAARERGDIGAIYPDYGPNHGYDYDSLPVLPGSHAVCITLVNVGAGSDTSLGCRTVQGSSFPSSNPVGGYDMANWTGAGTIRVAGWALDPDTAAPIPIQVTVDSLPPVTLVAAMERSDIGAIFPDYGPRHGYEYTTLPVLPGPHTVCITAVNIGAGSNTFLGCRTVSSSTFSSSSPVGGYDMANWTSPGTIRVAGWALDPDTAAPIPIQVTVDNLPPVTLIAARERGDIGAIFPDYGPYHGYDYDSLPVLPGSHTVCITLVNVGPGSNTDLGCRTI